MERKVGEAKGRKGGCFLIGVVVFAAIAIVTRIWYMEAPLLVEEVESALAEKPDTVDELCEKLRWQELRAPFQYDEVGRARSKVHEEGNTAVADFIRRNERYEPAFRSHAKWLVSGFGWGDVHRIRAIGAFKDLDRAWNIWSQLRETYWLLEDRNGRLVGYVKD